MWTSILSVVLVINELMASNTGSVMSPAYNFDSWIELYNPTEQAVNLSGMYLSDNADNLKRWQMPDEIGIIPAKGFFVVWLGSSDIRSDQAPFKLNCDGGTIFLSDRNGQLITSVQYPEAMSRTSWARKTDGGEAWGWTADITPGATNATSVFATKRLDAPIVSEGSRLISGPLTVKVTIPDGARLMYTTDGSIPMPLESPADDTPQPEWKNWVRNGDCEGEDATCFVCRDGDGSGDIGRITDGIGYNGSRGAKIHAIANPINSWDSQFFIYTPDHVWNVGDRYRFSMKVRADKPSHISAQSHRSPGDYIYWKMLDGGYNITTEWKQFDFEGTITENQGGTAGMQTIAFNLNEQSLENNFYFDEIVWEAYHDPTAGSGTTRQSKDGLFTVSRTTNYVFRLFRDGYLPCVPVTRSFILTDKQFTIPIVSIVGDERFFSDSMWGIDVKGTNGIPGNGREDAVNWNQPWDRPVNFSYISPDEGMLFNQDVNISVSGGWSRMNSPRSMKLKSNKVFDGLNHLDYPFFPQKPNIRSKAVVVRNGGNDSYARFMDPALTTIIQRSGIDLDVQSTVQVAEYINGRFKGVLNLREPNNDKFVYSNYGYDDEEIDMFENEVFMNGTDEAYRRLCKLSERINDTGVYDEVKTLLDIDEFTNYMAAELVLGNDDWPNNNVKAYRSRNDGRFRFILFDLDQPLNAWGHTISSLNDYRSVKMVRLFTNLLNHDEYRKKFIDTFCIMAGSVCEKERATAIVDELADAMRPMLQLDGRSPDGTANSIKEKLQNRLDEVISQLQQYTPMQLSDVSAQSLQLSADTEGAHIYLNGIDVPYAAFNGKFFVPYHLEAKAPAGYVFTGWKRSSSNDGKIFTACFKPLTEAGRMAQGLSPICINEVSAANGIYVNEFFKHHDWIELYNTTDKDINVEGMYLSDNLEEPKKYQISKTDGVSTIVPAHGYLIVWCDKLETKSQLHASFKLDADGGDILLTAADESWTDYIAYTSMKSDETVGRYPDGCQNVITMNVPTIGKANLSSSYSVPVEQPMVNGIHEVMAQQSSMQIYNLKGQAVAGTLQLGIYIQNGRKIIKK